MKLRSGYKFSDPECRRLKKELKIVPIVENIDIINTNNENNRSCLLPRSLCSLIMSSSSSEEMLPLLMSGLR